METLKIKPKRRHKRPDPVPESPVTEPVQEKQPVVDDHVVNITISAKNAIKMGVREDARATSKKIRAFEQNEVLKVEKEFLGKAKNWAKLAEEDGYVYLGKSADGYEKVSVEPDIPVQENAPTPELQKPALPDDISGGFDQISENGNKMIPFTFGGGNPSKMLTFEQHTALEEVLKTPGDEKTYVYAQVHTTTNDMGATVFDVAFCDNNGRSLYLQRTDVDLYDFKGSDNLRVFAEKPMTNNFVGPEFKHWVCRADSNVCIAVFSQWLDAFIESQRYIQFVMDNGWFKFPVLLSWIFGGAAFDAIPPTISPVLLDINHMVAESVLIKKPAGIKYEDAVRNVIPISIAFNTPRTEYLSQLGLTVDGEVPEYGDKTTIPLVDEVIVMRKVHESVAHFGQYPEVIQQ